ncbi:MAG: MFS transporter [Alphaproteobacteria bacterium]|nr:MFS transporter [Alphaproteobacteria bacterium]MCB9696605.1 MFS transporter [Alphaproteobacteria bacterium]
MSPRWLRLTALGALYLAQGLPYGFFTLALPVLLRQRGLDLATVSASSLLALPWAAKWMWGPVVDRYGTRRGWILPLQIGAASLLGGLAFVDADAGLAALAWGMLGVSVLSSTQDVATDALAVQLLGERDRGLGNGLQVGAYRIGMVVGGGAVPAIYGHFGPSWAFGALAVALALTTLPVLVVEEPARERAVNSLDPRRVLAPLVQRSEWPWLLVIATYKAGDHLAAPMARTLLVDRGWELTELGVLVGLGGSGLAAVGALGGGALVPWLGRRALAVALRAGDRRGRAGLRGGGSGLGTARRAPRRQHRHGGRVHGDDGPLPSTRPPGHRLRGPGSRLRARGRRGGCALGRAGRSRGIPGALRDLRGGDPGGCGARRRGGGRAGR